MFRRIDRAAQSRRRPSARARGVTTQPSFVARRISVRRKLRRVGCAAPRRSRRMTTSGDLSAISLIQASPGQLHQRGVGGLANDRPPRARWRAARRTLAARQPGAGLGAKRADDRLKPICESAAGGRFRLRARGKIARCAAARPPSPKTGSQPRRGWRRKDTPRRLRRATPADALIAARRRHGSLQRRCGIGRSGTPRRRTPNPRGSARPHARASSPRSWRRRLRSGRLRSARRPLRRERQATTGWCRARAYARPRARSRPAHW